MLPAAPEKLQSTQVTTDSIMLKFEVGWPMDNFPRPLEFDVTYTSPWDQQPQTVDASALGATPSHYKRFRPRPVLVPGLRPYTEYLLSVRVRSSLARSEDLWSPPGQLRVRTLPTVPAAAPEVDSGSFQLIATTGDSRTVLIYWRQIAPWQRNGANFSYCVSAHDSTGRSLLPSLATAAYARFEGVRGGATTVQVASCNAVGRSWRTSSVVVPDQRRVGTPPHSVTLRISGPGQYQLFWRHSGGHRTPDSFTLFSCEHRPDQPYQCQGQLTMWRVPGTTRQHNLTLPADTEYQFAVSANYEADYADSGGTATSSGMVWSRCSIPLSPDGAQVLQGLAVQSTGQRSVTLSWNDACASQVTVSRVLVIYCQLAGDKCQDAETSQEVARSGSSSLLVTGLRPFTRYRLAVRLITAGGRGPRSSAVVAETLPAPPEPPAGVTITTVTNTTLTVTWQPPTSPNGPLHHYELLVSGRSPVTIPSSRLSGTVSSLRAFSEYSLSVRACGESGCSRPTPQVAARTALGVPGPLEPPRPRLLNASAVLLHWRPPPLPGGPRPAYQLRTVAETDGVNFTQLETTVPGGQLEAPVLLARPCQIGAVSQRHLFWVRAGTVLPSEQVLWGPWSESAEQSCVFSGWPAGAVAGLVCGGLLLMAIAVLAFCLCSRTKRKWVKMRDIGVNLPSGLERPEKTLPGLRGAERRAGPVAAGYDRLVSPAAEESVTAADRPLLEEEDASPAACPEAGDAPLSAATDSRSCSSSSISCSYTDSGAESEKTASPTLEQRLWPAEDSPDLSPYVQAGGPGGPPPPAPAYTTFSPYVDAGAVRSLLSGAGVGSPSSEGAQTELSRSEPDLSAAAAGPPPYGKVGLRSSIGYVSMTSEEAPKAAKEPQRPYVALGPSAPAVGPAGIPPYVLAGPPAPEETPQDVRPPEHGVKEALERSNGYVMHEKLQPAGIELRDLTLADIQTGDASDDLEPVLSPKKLATVATVEDPYCRVVTQRQNGVELGNNVSMV